MSTTLYWLRHDLRLHDNPALALACRGAEQLLPVFVHPPQDEASPWGFARVGAHRRAFLAQALADLRANLQARGSDLLECTGAPQMVLPAIAQALGAARIVCEDIAAPYEQAEVAALRAAGLAVQTVWQSSLLCPADLPFAIDALPQVFTQFRQAVERAAVQPPAPLPTPQALPPLPLSSGMDLGSKQAPALIRKALAAIKPEANVAPNQALAAGAADVGLKQPLAPVQKAQAAIKTGVDAAPLHDPHSSFPYATPACHGGETAALAHLRQYLARKLPHSYKQTRNGLMGLDYSSKFSPWLATGALSARQVMAELRAFEDQHGANDGTYWLWFELLWRDHFRLLHLQHGAALYRARGLGAAPLPPHNAAGFAVWRRGDTGQSLVDAGMRELAATGYLSNRLRQIVASYLLHDLGGDWRAGAAWFEAQLLDYDTYSNQGNWLYVAGRGTDPRGGRRFNPDKQTHDHDADGQYRRLWGTA